MTIELSPTELQAAARIREASESGVPCPPVRDLIGTEDQDSAYRVQQFVLDQLQQQGRRVVGHKIGLTARVVQSQLGVNTPDFGVLLDDMVFSDQEPMDLGRFLQPRVEAEVAFVLSKSLESPQTNVADVISATEFVLPAIEVVDSRISNWDITITDTIADNASSGAIVLGTTPQTLFGLDLPSLGMTLSTDGQVISSGAGAACLGSPVIAVAWLARKLAATGSPLQAGQIILSGALGPMVGVTGPGAYCAEIEGLGSVNAVFTQSTNKEKL